MTRLYLLSLLLLAGCKKQEKAPYTVCSPDGSECRYYGFCLGEPPPAPSLEKAVHPPLIVGYLPPASKPKRKSKPSSPEQGGQQ